MPIPKKGETKKDFISRCIPFVIEEGTTDDPKQAAAICYSIWRRSKKKSAEELKIKIDKLKSELKDIKEKM